MPKKRLIYTLLYDEGYFVQSRNFRRQRVGDLGWLADIYGFSNIAQSVDELVLLNVSTNADWNGRFIEACSKIAERFFAPIAVGGGIRTLSQARQAIEIGAEKVVVNSMLDWENVSVLEEIAATYGRQAVVGSIDLKRDSAGGYGAYVGGGRQLASRSAAQHVARASKLSIGELMIGSIDQDGTGMGLDLATLDLVPETTGLPIVLCGGAGNQSHLFAALEHPRVDGVATANLLNFVGDGLARARQWLREENRVDLAHW